MSNNIERGPEPFESRHSREHEPKVCLVNELENMRNEGHLADRLSSLAEISPEYDADSVRTVEIQCELCGAGCSITHDGEKILKVDEPIVGPTLSTCPENE